MNLHRINRVAKLSGLSKDVIRVWERRYGVVQPTRGANRYRLYTDDEVTLLRYLKAAVEKGESIGELVTQGREALLGHAKTNALTSEVGSAPYEGFIGELITALNPLDRETFERRLNGAVAVIPFEEALHKILLPLQERVGHLWHDGRLGVGVEHYVTKQVQQKIFAAMNQLPMTEYGPKIVVACPSGEQHEIAAQAVAYLCSARGCRVSYLGPNTPLAELAAFCQLGTPKLILLSLTSVPTPDDALDFVREVRKLLMAHAPVAVGGIAGRAKRSIFEHAHIVVLDDLIELERRVVSLVASTRSAR